MPTIINTFTLCGHIVAMIHFLSVNTEMFDQPNINITGLSYIKSVSLNLEFENHKPITW